MAAAKDKMLLCKCYDHWFIWTDDKEQQFFTEASARRITKTLREDTNRKMTVKIVHKPKGMQ